MSLTPPPPRLILSSLELLSGVRCKQQYTDHLGARLAIPTLSNPNETSDHSGGGSGPPTRSSRPTGVWLSSP